MMQKIFHFMWVLTVLSLIMMNSCSDSTSPASKETPEEKVMVENDKHIVTIYNQEDSLKFVLEAINDTTNNVIWGNNVYDQAKLYIDMNQNNKRDYNMDRIYGYTIHQNICCQHQLSENMVSYCDALGSEATVDIQFTSTENEPRDHPVWTFTIPKTEIFENKSVNFIVEFSKDSKMSGVYPEENLPPDFQDGNDFSYPISSMLIFP